MKLIQEVEQPAGIRSAGSPSLPPVAQQAIWYFYRSNLERVVVKVAFIKIRVKDLRILFELLAGPEPG
jgi:hypothetical protein